MKWLWRAFELLYMVRIVLWTSAVLFVVLAVAIDIAVLRIVFGVLAGGSVLSAFAVGRARLRMKSRQAQKADDRWKAFMRERKRIGDMAEFKLTSEVAAAVGRKFGLADEPSAFITKKWKGRLSSRRMVFDAKSHSEKRQSKVHDVPEAAYIVGDSEARDFFKSLVAREPQQALGELREMFSVADMALPSAADIGVETDSHRQALETKRASFGEEVVKLTMPA